VWLAALLVPVNTAVGGSDVAYWLTVLHNNDGESVLLPRRVETEEGVREFGGVARFTTLVKRTKQQALEVAAKERGVGHGVLMVSSGDNFLAGPIFAASLRNGPPFFDAIAMTEIGYDAVCIGNHEFDFGPEVFADFVKSMPAEVPFLTSNLNFRDEPTLAALVAEGRIVKSLLIEKGGQLIGVVGATTEALPSVSSPRRVSVDRVVPAVQREVGRLQARGTNKIILLSHLQDIAQELETVGRLRGVDVVVAGGGNELLANPDDAIVPGEGDQVSGPYPLLAEDADGRPVAVVTTNGRYSYLGKLVIGFDAQGEVVEIDLDNSGPIRVAGAGSEDGLEPDPKVEASVSEPLRAEVKELAEQVLGVSSIPLDGRRIKVRTGETNLGNLLADALLWQARELADLFGVSAPNVALQNGGGIRNDELIPAGEITEFGTFEVAPFPNFISIVTEVSREDFKGILENAVSRGDSPAGRFAQIGGFSLRWDAVEAARQIGEDGKLVHSGDRVRDVVLADGTEIVKNGVLIAGPALNVATVDFLARGGDDYPFRGRDYVTLGVTYQQALHNYIVEELQGRITEDRYPAALARIIRNH
jgi:5'-nucleotidase